MTVYPVCFIKAKQPKQNRREKKNRSRRVLFMCVCEKFPTKIESGEGSYVLSVCYKYPCNKQTLYNYMCKIDAWP